MLLSLRYVTLRYYLLLIAKLNPLIATLKPQSNGPSYSNTVIGTLAVDGWYSEEGTVRGPSPPRHLLTVPNVTAQPSTASAVYQLRIIRCGTIILHLESKGSTDDGSFHFLA